MAAKERCRQCGRLLPIGQLVKDAAGYLCSKESACVKARLKQEQEQASQPPVLHAE